MLPDTCYSVFGKSLTTDLTCAVSQAVHILNTYEIVPEWTYDVRRLNCAISFR